MHRTRLDVLEHLLPKLQIPRSLLTEDGALRPEDLFEAVPEKLHLEIGFGNGEHVTALLNANPTHHVIGAEPFINGMGAFLKDIKDDPPLERCRVLMDDAMLILNSLADQTVDFLYILNPDPWPKTRHHKRRMVISHNLNVFARILKDNATMIQTTDVDDLAGWMVTESVNCPDFEWQAESAADWRTPPPGWLPTRYEQKGREAGRKQTYLVYKRRPRHS
jgi:tRNA (guanine-N7-)-methyltransferase